eukprot:TRINITY_DN362_c0_g1_i5.p1 TRINITY_DN362_c0_g1~~TRINITY_DN362_c0_g1_i5.p1  ORF type:complete len:450 (-),score=23.28 TRINITY_DN362_c0_g1_i5:372-1721(-)
MAWSWAAHTFRANLSRLFTHGYCVLDNVLPRQQLLNLRDQILNGVEANPSLLSHNCTIAITPTSSTKYIPKRLIAEFDFSNKSVCTSFPSLYSFVRDPSLRQVLQQELHEILSPHRAGQSPCLRTSPSSNNEMCGYYPFKLPSYQPWLAFSAGHVTLSSQSVKAQVNFGDGACFPIHVDSDLENVSDQRVLTAILYLNDEWEGGALRLYPLPFSPVNINPAMGRLVVFPTGSCLHRVLPSRSPRLSLTHWILASASPNLSDATSFPDDSARTSGHGGESSVGVHQSVSQQFRSASKEALKCTAATTRPQSLGSIEDRKYEDSAEMENVQVSVPGRKELNGGLESEKKDRKGLQIQERVPVFYPFPAASLSPEELATLLAQPVTRVHLGKLLYSDEWAESIRESHVDSTDRQYLLERHYADVAMIARKWSPHMRHVEEWLKAHQHSEIGR